MVLLYPLEDWRLIWYRKDHSGDARCDLVESFMLSSVLQDPGYPTTEVFAEDTQPSCRRRSIRPAAHR